MRRFFFNVIFVLMLFFSLALMGVVHAEDFRNDYKVEYFPTTQQNNIATRVKFTITLTNLRSDVYVKKISLAFPKSFVINNIVASDDKGKVTPSITDDDKKTNIQLEFNDPSVGRDTVNHFYLEFQQDNLFKLHGNVWEVILPTMEDKTRSSYQITVHLPENTPKKISVAKPKPDEIKGNAIVWNNPTAKTIYAAFGDKQYYDSKLNYHLENPKVIPVYTDVAFPPDTSFQKVYIKSIEPKPDETFTDEDGNFMGRYVLKPRQKIDVKYHGIIEIFSVPREDNKEVLMSLLPSQKDYLLTQKSYWDLQSTAETASLKNPREIYDFITKKFTYNYKRVSKDIKRLGAKQAMEHPDQAVCVEFSDTFIAIAREKGIYSREIQGYGFSNDPQLRPISDVSDVLHSWPEYYDEARGLWIPVDPTWENTSGIDYYSSLDFNHITFAIHGKRPDYPPPAGSYKIEDTRDISIAPTSSAPQDDVKLSILPFELPTRIVDNKSYTAKFKVKNNGNTYAYNVPVSFQSDVLQVANAKTVIPMLAPFEEKEVVIEYKTEKVNKQTTAIVNVSLLNDVVYTGKITVIPFYYDIGLKVAYVIMGIAAIFLSISLIKRLRKKEPLPPEV